MRELRIHDERIEGIHECLRFVHVNVPFQWEVWCPEYWLGCKEKADKCPPGLAAECKTFFLAEIRNLPRMSHEEFIAKEWTRLLDKWASLHPEHFEVWSDWWICGGLKSTYYGLIR